MAIPQEAVKQKPSRGISATLERITEMSVDTYYNPYKMFQWPESLPDDQWWMSRELMTVANTRFTEELNESQLKALSKWESIYFYSLNVHGIRELLVEVVARVQTPGYEEESEFFHHFIGEENEHMWFFAKFCWNYGKKIYPNRKLSFSIGETSPEIESFLVFSRILIFEEIVDFFNSRMGRDETLDPIIRQVNSIHHQDESRHIVFGREVVKKLHGYICEHESEDQVRAAEKYVKRYIVASIQSLYNPIVYKDAGIPEPYKMRTELLADPARRDVDRKTLRRTTDYMQKNGIIPKGDIFSELSN
ncbi:MAG TPA: diiron oxygenase [Thermoanaerobaculia bacterium]|jgi:hypothetical protein